jgi:hypothetical protein
MTLEEQGMQILMGRGRQMMLEEYQIVQSAREERRSIQQEAEEQLQLMLMALEDSRRIQPMGEKQCLSQRRMARP